MFSVLKKISKNDTGSIIFESFLGRSPRSDKLGQRQYDEFASRDYNSRSPDRRQERRRCDYDRDYNSRRRRSRSRSRSRDRSYSRSSRNRSRSRERRRDRSPDYRREREDSRDRRSSRYDREVSVTLILMRVFSLVSFVAAKRRLEAKLK